MKVVYIEEPGKIRLNERETPVPKEGEALLKVKYCGICGSDVATFTGNQPFTTYPRIPGHEFSAEIVEIGPNELGLKTGMPVTANPYFNCGKCYSCRKGKVNCCENNQTMGVQRDGAFAEYIVMPVERIIPGENLSPEALALIEPFSIGFHAVSRGNIQPLDKVLVIGAGPIGIFAMLAAKMRGAKVFSADLMDKRLELAKNMGADGVINTGTEDLAEKVRCLTQNNGVDVAVEAAGLSNTFLNCIESVCFGGKIILIGNGKKETTFNHSILLKKELSVFGSRNSLHDFEPLIRIVAGGHVKIDSIISDVFPLEQVVGAFAALRNNDGSKAKVLVKFEN
jgi:2-desacetyl-2-hydroxyethyl bacteriochlorophyllide A dehydrogenase